MGKLSRDLEPTPDADLVEAIGRGDVSAFDELYARYRDWVFRLAYRFTGDERNAEDVLHAAFAHLLEKSPRLPLYLRLTTFLYPAVKRLSLSMLRDRGRTTVVDAILERLFSAKTTPEQSAQAELASGVALLPQEQRETLLMHSVDGMSLEEIGEALGIPEGTAESRLRKAIAALRGDPHARAYFEE